MLSTPVGPIHTGFALTLIGQQLVDGGIGLRINRDALKQARTAELKNERGLIGFFMEFFHIYIFSIRAGILRFIYLFC